MTQYPPPWPPAEPFPESTQELEGGGTHFPSSAGDRERGKFRPGRIPLTTTLAVVDDDGKRVGTALIPSFDELIYEIRQLRLALTLAGTAADMGDL